MLGFLGLGFHRAAAQPRDGRQRRVVARDVSTKQPPRLALPSRRRPCRAAGAPGSSPCTSRRSQCGRAARALGTGGESASASLWRRPAVPPRNAQRDYEKVGASFVAQLVMIRVRAEQCARLAAGPRRRDRPSDVEIAYGCWLPTPGCQQHGGRLRKSCCSSRTRPGRIPLAC